MDDSTPMTFGIHRGKALANVPAKYLLWLHREGKCFGALKKYIEENMEVLKIEVEKEKE